MWPYRNLPAWFGLWPALAGDRQGPTAPVLDHVVIRKPATGGEITNIRFLQAEPKAPRKPLFMSTRRRQ